MSNVPPHLLGGKNTNVGGIVMADAGEFCEGVKRLLFPSLTRPVM